jgi:hypothetical protein
MAADTLKYYKRACGSGEQQNKVRVGADNNTNTTKTEQPEVFDVKIRKDILDQLHADTITALRAVTLGDIVDKAYGAS